MPNRFYIVDFCKHRMLSKIDKTVDLQTPFNNAANAIVGGASLGCNVPVSHTSGNTGFVLSRVNHNTGVRTSTLLSSVDSNLITNPGETAWMHGIRTSVLSGTVAYDYPVSAITRNYHVTIAGTEWMRDIGGIQLSPDLPSISRIRFGDQLGIKRTAIVGLNQEFLVQDKVKASHIHRHYAQVASIPTQSESLSLFYDLGVYNWPTENLTFVQEYQQRFIYDDGSSPTHATFAWDFAVRIWNTWPAIVGHSATTYTPANTNGPLQDRRYSLVQLDEITTPFYGGTIAGTFALPGPRPGAVLYGSIIPNGGPTAQLNINGVDQIGSFGSASMPSPQHTQWAAPLVSALPNTTYDSALLYPNDNINQWVFNIVTPQDTTTVTFTFAAVPVNGLNYEGIVYFHGSPFPFPA